MPIYEYECANCGHNLEVIQKISDKPLKECPACHQQQLRKLVSAAAFKLKGTGWYVTDFKDKPKSTGPAKKDADTAGPAGGDNKDTKKEPASAAANETATASTKKSTTSTD